MPRAFLRHSCAARRHGRHQSNLEPEADAFDGGCVPDWRAASREKPPVHCVGKALRHMRRCRGKARPETPPRRSRASVSIAGRATQPVELPPMTVKSTSLQSFTVPEFFARCVRQCYTPCSGKTHRETRTSTNYGEAKATPVSISVVDNGHPAKFIAMDRGAIGNTAATKEPFLIAMGHAVARHAALRADSSLPTGMDLSTWWPLKTQQAATFG